MITTVNPATNSNLDTRGKLIEHHKLRGGMMTGSDRAGRHIGYAAAKALRITLLGLGISDFYLDLEDAVEAPIKFSVRRRPNNNGDA